MKLFRKKAQPLAPKKLDWTQREASTPEDFFNRGMAWYARKEYQKAEADLREALASRPDFTDARYGLGLVLKAAGRASEAREAFQQTLELLPQMQAENPNRAGMLRHLIQAHLNTL